MCNANCWASALASSCGEQVTAFREYAMDEVRRVLNRSAPKTCMLDPIPTDVPLEFINVILSYITSTCNASMRYGNLPISQKAAIIAPILKKRGLDVNDVKSYRPISNLTFILKVIEWIVVYTNEGIPSRDWLDAAHAIGLQGWTLNINSHPENAVGYTGRRLFTRNSVAGPTGHECCFWHCWFRYIIAATRIIVDTRHVLKWLTSFVIDRT